MTFRELVQAVGGHAARPLGIDPPTDEDLERWLLLAVLSGGRGGPSRGAEALGRLDRAGLGSLGALSRADPIDLAFRLDAAGVARAEVVAARLQHLAGQLPPSGVDTLARGADDLASLGAALADLAPGFGARAVARFLRPLRDRWTAADALPLAPEALAAAAHLGWLDAEADAELAVGTLRQRLADAQDAPDLCDVEAALERLGAACLRERVARCPLHQRCPARAARADVASFGTSD